MVAIVSGEARRWILVDSSSGVLSGDGAGRLTAVDGVGGGCWFVC